MGMFDGSGMQMMLKNLLQAAAPDLAAQVDAVGATVQNFDQRLARVEASNARILEILETLNSKGNEHGTGSGDGRDGQRLLGASGHAGNGIHGVE